MAAVPPPAAPGLTPASIKKYAGSAPINFRLILVNCLLIGGCGYVLYASVVRYNVALDDFDRVARTNVLTTRPCGLAVPRTKYMLESLNEISDGAFAEVKEESYVNRIQNALCGTGVVVNALRAGLQAKEIEEYDPDDDGLASNASVKAYVCACKSASCNAKEYGDFLRRVTHAYVLAAPAFERYEHGLVATLNCMRGNNPFADGVCANGELIRTQLTDAATNAMALLSGSDSEAYPRLHEQIYRLLALSVLEYRDRANNDGMCFKNTDAQVSPLALCQSKLAEYIASNKEQGAVLSKPNATKQLYYQRVAGTSTCDWSSATDSAETNPSMPAVRARKFGADYYLSTTTPVVGVCASMLEFGWLGRKRLFGIPDPASNAQWYPEHFGSGFSRWLAGWTYYGLYDANKGRAETYDKHTAFLDLKLFVGYKFASTSAWVLAVCIACGYLLTFGLTPFVKLIYVRCVRRTLTATKTDTIISKPLTTGGVAALVVTILVGLWVIFVDGGVSVPYSATTVCDDYALSGGPYVTIDERAPDGILGLVLIVIGTFLLMYMSLCRRTPRRSRVMPLNAVSLWPIFALIFIVLIAGLILMIVAGDEWWNRESTDVDGSDTKTTDDFEEIVGAILWALVVLGATAGLLAQRHMAANVMLNVPRGRIPVFAYAYAGGGLALTILAAVLLWPLFDCALEFEANEIVCGNDVEIKLRWTRFWGCVAWAASVIAIAFVIFSGYKVLFTTPRRGDAASQAFNRSKAAEIRLLAERRNQRRFGTAPAPPPAAPIRGLAAPGAAVLTGAMFDNDLSSDDDDDDAHSLDLEGTEGTLPPATLTANRVTFKLPNLGGTAATNATNAAPARVSGTVPAAFVVSPGGVPHAC